MAQTAPEDVAPIVATLPPDLTQLLQSMARDLATLGQAIEQLKASQERMARDHVNAVDLLRASQEQMARVVAKASEAKASEQNLRPKTSAPPPRPTSAPTPRPDRHLTTRKRCLDALTIPALDISPRWPSRSPPTFRTLRFVRAGGNAHHDDLRPVTEPSAAYVGAGSPSCAVQEHVGQTRKRASFKSGPLMALRSAVAEAPMSWAAGSAAEALASEALATTRPFVPGSP